MSFPYPLPPPGCLLAPALPCVCVCARAHVCTGGLACAHPCTHVPVSTSLPTKPRGAAQPSARGSCRKPGHALQDETHPGPEGPSDAHLSGGPSSSFLGQGSQGPLCPEGAVHPPRPSFPKPTWLPQRSQTQAWNSRKGNTAVQEGRPGAARGKGGGAGRNFQGEENVLRPYGAGGHQTYALKCNDTSIKLTTTTKPSCAPQPSARLSSTSCVPGTAAGKTDGTLSSRGTGRRKVKSLPRM